MTIYIGNIFRRKKFESSEDITKTQLARVLNTFDLTTLGIGCTLGSGIYVVAGEVARDIAGPAVVISFLIAAIASILAGLCYAEFGARVPKAGSAYIYSYVTVGEFWAFIVGWNLILEYVIGSASVARGFSAYFDSLLNNTISDHFREHFPLNVPTLSPYPDFFAFGVALLVALVLCLGVKESTTINSVFTFVNLGVVTFVIIAGSIKADPDNWKLSKNELPGANVTSEYGAGGFLPYGTQGLLAGAATCFYAFVGFDTIATTGEEVKNPQKSIPLGIVLSLMFCTLAYCGVSTVITLMVPYYDLDPYAPLPGAFASVGWTVPKYLVSVGAVCGLSTSLLGSLFPLPRVIYAMAKDGLIFRFLGHITERFKTPTLATVLSGLFAATMAMLFDIKQLVEMLSIGTLLAYTLVATSVLVLRYDTAILPSSNVNEPHNIDERPAVSSGLENKQNEETTNNAEEGGICTHLFSPKNKFPTNRSSWIVKACVVLLVVSLGTASGLQQHSSEMPTVGWTVGLGISCAIILLVLIVIARQPQSASTVNLSFKVPLVPLVPALSIFFNVYLMLELSKLTWIRFAIWMAIGFLNYFLYGMWHSSENPKNSYEDLTADQAPSVTDTEMEHMAKPDPATKETSKLIKSMFR